ncbi:MAG: IS1634 family transposase, partial [Hormoscilla sp. SP5CHS1]|nr:IS1634 family transposase [Hormoscilla sp. SP5CHS1]
LWMKMGDGNQSDQKQFAQTIKEFKKTFEFSGLMVADAALYTQDNLQYLGNIEWLTRVPLTIKAAQKLVREMDANTLISSQQVGYSYAEVMQKYGGIEQRWLVVER